MSLNKTRKRLIKKCRKLYNSYPIGLKFSADGGKTFIALGNIVETYIPNTKNIASGSINASKLSVDSLGLKEFEVTLKQDFSKEKMKKFKGILW